MRQHPAGVAVAVTIPFLDLNGDPVTPTGLSVRVVDEDGTEVVAPTVVALDPDDTEMSFQVPGLANHVSGSTGARTVELTMTTAAGPIVAQETYLLKAAVSLAVPANSFQTVEGALVMASTMVGLGGFEAADAASRANALQEAFRRLVRLGYRIRRPEDVDTMSYIPDDDERIQPRYWPLMTLDRWKSLPVGFREAMRRAQVQEANEILLGDVVGDKRRSGLMSESVGESSMMFRPGKPLELGVSAKTFAHLTGYVDFRITVTRS